MRFIYDGKKFLDASAGYIGQKAEDGTILDSLNDFSDWVVQSEVNVIFKPILSLLSEGLHEFGVWFVANLPDIMGYCTITAGVFAIIGSMTGKGGLMKPLGYLAGGLITAVCILGGV